MNHDFFIRTTNRIALYATAALIYWAFIFLLITVFDLKIFRQQMTETFFLSLLAIFAILGGAIVLNVMSNLSKISDAVSAKAEANSGTNSGTPTETAKPFAWRLLVMALSFPLIAAGLFAGNALSAQHKKNLLVNSAQKLVAENQAWLASLSDYQFSLAYVKKTESKLDVIKKIDKHFPEVVLIVPDSIDGKKLFLAFGGRHYINDKEAHEKSSYIYSASKDERAYLDTIFSTDAMTQRFHAEKGNYQLYFPTTFAGKKFVLYFSDYQRYGKMGS